MHKYTHFIRFLKLSCFQTIVLEITVYLPSSVLNCLKWWRVEWEPLGVFCPYFVQRVHIFGAISRGYWLGVSRGRRTRAGPHHAVRGARGRTRAGAQHSIGGGARTGWWTRTGGTPHGRIRCWHRPGSPGRKGSKIGRKPLQKWPFNMQKSLGRFDISYRCSDTGAELPKPDAHLCLII